MISLIHSRYKYGTAYSIYSSTVLLYSTVQIVEDGTHFFGFVVFNNHSIKYAEALRESQIFHAYCRRSKEFQIASLLLVTGNAGACILIYDKAISSITV